jgi:ADP-ribose pyrophosphatase
LLKQYRYAVDQYIFEAPAGTMEEDEDPIETAQRELIEETGFVAKTIVPKGFIYTTPGYTDEKIFLFEARDLSPSEEFGKDEDEIIEVMDVATSDLNDMIINGIIVDAKTICLIHRCLGC